MRYKQQLTPYCLGEAVTDVASAGIDAGVLTAGVQSRRARTRRTCTAGELAPKRVPGYDDLLEAAERLPNLTPEQLDAKWILGDTANVLRESPFETHPALDEIHLNAIGKAADDIANGRPVDVSQFIEQHKAIEPIARATDAVVDEIEPEGSLARIAQRKQVADLLA